MEKYPVPKIEVGLKFKSGENEGEVISINCEFCKVKINGFEYPQDLIIVNCERNFKFGIWKKI